MEKTLTAYSLNQLEVIYDAYDRVYDIASHRWHAFKYYVPEFKVSNLFGHYVRSFNKDRDPATISINQYMTAAAPLSAALNSILELVIPDDQDAWDIYAICEGRSLVFRQPDPKDRCMAIFHLIEHKYPRAKYRQAKSNKHNKPMEPQRPVLQKWLPYKED